MLGAALEMKEVQVWKDVDGAWCCRRLHDMYIRNLGAEGISWSSLGCAMLGPLSPRSHCSCLGRLVEVYVLHVWTIRFYLHIGRPGPDRPKEDKTHAYLSALKCPWQPIPLLQTAGVLTSDPRLVAGARPVTELTFEEATELAYFGAQVRLYT